MLTKKKAKEFQSIVAPKQLSAKVSKRSPELLSKPGNNRYYYALFLILLITFIAYLPVLYNAFVNWDDYQYIQNDPLIHAVNFKDIFSGYIMGNYHPLTMLAYAIEYHFWGLNEKGFHAVNLLFHLLNVILVFYAVFLLSEKKEVAIIAAALFGVHPMHVESVAWASELKDLLFVFFFLAAYICYLQYLKMRYEYEKNTNLRKADKFVFRKSATIRYLYLSFCLLFFLFSLLSKAMAVSFPMVLLLTDYYLKRFETIDLRQETKPQQLGLTSHVSRLTSVLIEKAPFFALSLIFGVIAVFAQKSASALHTGYFTFPQRIVFASYSFITYLVKLVLPLHLSAFYSYPVRNGDSIPLQYYGYLLLFLGLAVCVWYSLRFTKKIFFGIGFFTITVFIVLQLLPVGSIMMADRYTYLPSIGIFYLAGEGIVILWNKKGATRNLRLPAILLLTIALVFYSAKTYAQCGIWKNSLSLWNDVISRDETIAIAYYNRGFYYLKEKRYEEALNDFNKAIELQPDDVDAIYNQGLIFENEKKYEEAISDFNKIIALNSRHVDAYNHLGFIFEKEQKYEEALHDFGIAISLQPDLAKTYNNHGIVLNDLKRYEEAISDYNKAIRFQPDLAEAYFNRGIVLNKIKRYEEALKDYNKAIELHPDFAPAYYNRGLSECYLGNKNSSCRDFKQAAALGYQLTANACLNFCH